MGWVVKHRTSGEQVGPEFRKRRDAEIAAGNDPDLELHPTRIPPELLPGKPPAAPWGGTLRERAERHRKRGQASL